MWILQRQAGNHDQGKKEREQVTNAPAGELFQNNKKCCIHKSAAVFSDIAVFFCCNAMDWRYMAEHVGARWSEKAKAG
jgi:hypothetical protein